MGDKTIIRLPMGNHRADVFDTFSVPVPYGVAKMSRKVGEVEASIIMEIDPSRLRSYFQKALLSKRGISRLANGGINFTIDKKTKRRTELKGVEDGR